MASRAAHREDLSALRRSAWPAYLREHSGLPGPRANLELAQALADVGDSKVYDALIDLDDEYLVLCGVIGLGQLLALGGDVQARLRFHATDPRWRIREGVAMALQRLGDADFARLWTLARAWVDDADPLVQRAAVAGVCEPRLLGTPDRALRAVDLSELATDSLAARSASDRNGDGVRALRKALGYCWSVAVAADPAPGLVRFRALEQRRDADVAWVVRENSKKSRLARLL